MPTHPFKQVDVFTARPFFGNPVAVVFDADGLSTDEMQRIAAWTNLSETTFVLQTTLPQPAYRLRIFTPDHELPFAGHPTVGTCHAVLEAGLVSPREGRLLQECGAGNLKLRVEEQAIYVVAPQAAFVRDAPELAGVLSDALGGRVFDSPAPGTFRNGPAWLLAQVDDVASLQPDMSAIATLSREQSVTGVAPFTLLGAGDFAVHIRCFAPAAGVPEDPVTGSANAALPAWLAHHGLLERTGRSYVSTQGKELGRDGRVFVRVLDDDGRAEIGGHAVTVVEGRITF